MATTLTLKNIPESTRLPFLNSYATAIARRTTANS